MSVVALRTGAAALLAVTLAACADKGPSTPTQLPAVTLSFTSQPRDATAGVALAGVAVTILDASGSAVRGATNAVTIGLGASSGGAALGGTTTANALNGVATFGDLHVDRSGSGYTLVATSTGLSQATSTGFAINSAAASKLTFPVPPVAVTQGSQLPAVQVALYDAFGNAVTSAATPVSMALGINPTSAVLYGTTTVNAAHGVAQFPDLYLDRIGRGYALTATAGTLPAATSSSFDITAAVCGDSAWMSTPGLGYRVTVGVTAGSGQVAFPSADSDWELRYQYIVPPLPCTSTWNYTNETLYLWGDVDFDQYGSNGANPLSPYLFNQIVPQLMMGSDYAGEGSDSAYHQVGNAFSRWVIQAQYFWEHSNGTAYALAGRALPVNPGDEVTTTIDYSAASGAVTASISTAAGVSTITIARPFPNEQPALFSSWKDFFQQAATQSTTIFGRPVINVETHAVEQNSVCALLPLSIGQMSVPGANTAAQFTVGTIGGLSCSGALVNLLF